MAADSDPLLATCVAGRTAAIERGFGCRGSGVGVARGWTTERPCSLRHRARSTWIGAAGSVDETTEFDARGDRRCDRASVLGDRCSRAETVSRSIGALAPDAGVLTAPTCDRGLVRSGRRRALAWRAHCVGCEAMSGRAADRAVRWQPGPRWVGARARLRRFGRAAWMRGFERWPPRRFQARRLRGRPNR